MTDNFAEHTAWKKRCDLELKRKNEHDMIFKNRTPLIQSKYDVHLLHR
jgi:hypothetical protein